MTPTDLAAALIAGVPRFALIDGPYGPFMGRATSGEYLHVSDVSSALTAALYGVDERAGEVLEGVTPGPWETDERLHDAPYQTIRIGPSGNYRVCKVWQDDCADDYNPEQRANARFIAWCREGVPALLAQNAALRAERDELRAEAAEAQIAALTARVEGLTGAGSNLVAQLYQMWTEARDHRDRGDLGSAEYAKRDMVASAFRDAYLAARATLSATTEADNA